MIIITRVKEIAESFIKILAFGRNDARTAPQVCPAGFDSKPVLDDVAAYAKSTNDSEPVILGYVRTSTVGEGESIMYSTDSTGARVFEIYLKDDGTCEFGGSADNMVRYSVVKSAYDQLKADHDALINAFNIHVHVPGATPTPVPGIIPATASTGNIDASKIDNIKTN